MICVEVTAPGGRTYRLDTPDPELIGTWLKALFDSWNGPRPAIPTRFVVEIS